MHVERVPDLGVLTLWLRTEEHVGRPAAAADQNPSAVDSEEAATLRRRLRGDLSNAEPQTLRIGHASALDELERQRVELRLAELYRPP